MTAAVIGEWSLYLIQTPSMSVHPDYPTFHPFRQVATMFKSRFSRIACPQVGDNRIQLCS